jgi:iron(II)-dependent oxidoreductase
MDQNQLRIVEFIATLSIQTLIRMKQTLTAMLILLVALKMYAQTPASEDPEGMVWVEGGTFIMGSGANPHAIDFPPHPVTLARYYMDKCEVTNGQYYEFCTSTGHRLPEFWGMDIYKSGSAFQDYPVVGVNQYEASEYAAWKGKRLPTEAEWEYAARGGLQDVEFPFGEFADHSKARFNDPESEKGPVAVGSYEPNGYGLYDLSGNVWEWVSDWFDEGYYAISPVENPIGPSAGNFKAFRGGGWHSGASCITVHRRNALPQYWVDIAGGFRCVKDP